MTMTANSCFFFSGVSYHNMSLRTSFLVGPEDRSPTDWAKEVSLWSWFKEWQGEVRSLLMGKAKISTSREVELFMEGFSPQEVVSLVEEKRIGKRSDRPLYMEWTQSVRMVWGEMPSPEKTEAMFLSGMTSEETIDRLFREIAMTEGGTRKLRQPRKVFSNKVKGNFNSLHK